MELTFVSVTAIIIAAYISIRYTLREKKLYEEFLTLLLSGEDWCYAEELITMSNGALQKYKIHLILGYMSGIGVLERKVGEHGRSMFRLTEVE